jgi:hypothetical protein
MVTLGGACPIDFAWSHHPQFVLCLHVQVTHKVSGEKMVIKELFKFDKEAQKNFLHEVSVLSFQLLLFFFHAQFADCCVAYQRHYGLLKMRISV